MTRLIFFIFISIFVFQNSTAQTKGPGLAIQKFAADTVLKAIDEVTRELSIKHPGFYRYHSKEDFNQYIDSVKATVRDSLTELEAYLKLKPIISYMDCIHTGLSLPQEYKDYQNQKPNLFPFQVYCFGSRAFVFKNFSTCNSIATGDEILSVNGQGMDKIILKLLRLIPSDGYNLTRKYRALYFQFPGWYRNIDLKESFLVVVNQHGKEQAYQIEGKKFKDIAEEGFLLEPKRTIQLEFKIENKISYCFDKPFRYWDRIEVTQAVANEIHGAALRMFYRKPVQKDSIWLWQRARYSDEFNFYMEQKPARNNCRGKVYVLMNGFCMSSCADVIAILSYNKKVTLIGQETGGGYQGNNSGMIPDSKVKPFDFTLSVPLQKYVNHVDRSMNIGRGTMPDYVINRTIDDLLKGEDLELNLANELIGRLKNEPAH